MFNMYTVDIADEAYVVLQEGEGESAVRLAFNAEWAGRVAIGMLQFALGIMPANESNEEDN